jgi:hypothetical protein
MEDKKHEGSLPRTLASPNFSPEKLVNGLLHGFVSNSYINNIMVTEYPLKEKHEK